MSADNQAKLCLYNLKIFVRYKYDSMEAFYADLDRRITSQYETATRDDIRERVKYVKDVWKGKRNIGNTWQERIERYLGLKKGSLMSPYMPRATSYVQIHCRGSDVPRLFDAITKNQKKWQIVEECSVISGSAALFIKLHGTEHETAEILTKNLYGVVDVEIYHTVTNRSFQEYTWERYDIDKFARHSSPPYWYHDGEEEEEEEEKIMEELN